MVSVRPLGDNRTAAHIVAYLPRSRSRLLDAARLRLRRFFIHAFVGADRSRLDGLRPGPLHLIDADDELRAYLQWVARASNGLPADAMTMPSIDRCELVAGGGM